MRVLATIALTGLTLGLGQFGLAQSAEAQSRRMIIEVKPRSWLDAGKVVPVGSLQNYVYDQQGGSLSGSYRFNGARGGDFGLLPDRFSAGRGFVFDTPRFNILN